MKRRNFVKTSGYSLGAVGLANLVSTHGYAEVTDCEMEDQKAGTYDVDEYTLKAGLTQAEKDAIKAAFNGAANQTAVDNLIRDKERDGTFIGNGGDKEEGDLMVSTCKKYGTKEITPSSNHTRTQTTTITGDKLTITTIWRTRLAIDCDGKDVADADDKETQKPKTPTP